MEDGKEGEGGWTEGYEERGRWRTGRVKGRRGKRKGEGEEESMIGGLDVEVKELGFGLV